MKQTKNKKIAIVDDDVFLLDMYSLKFKKEGFDVVVYNNGKDAIEKIPIDQPNIVLLDIIMPQIDGIKVLQSLKNKPQTKDIPVILLTNLDGEEIRKKGARSGALYFINKAEYLPSNIAKMVNEVLADK